MELRNSYDCSGMAKLASNCRIVERKYVIIGYYLPAEMAEVLHSVRLFALEYMIPGRYLWTAIPDEWLSAGGNNASPATGNGEDKNLFLLHPTSHTDKAHKSIPALKRCSLNCLAIYCRWGYITAIYIRVF